jgi:hypothetical protein
MEERSLLSQEKSSVSVDSDEKNVTVNNAFVSREKCENKIES